MKRNEDRRRKRRDVSLDEALEEPEQGYRRKIKGDISERETSNVKRWDKDRQRGDLDEDIEREKYEENRRRKKRDTSLDEASEEPAQVEGRGKRKGDISERETSNVKRWDKDRQRGDLDEDIEREKYEENRRRKKRNPQIYFKGDTSLDEASEEPAQVEGRGKRKGDISERETSNVKRWDKDRQRGDLDEDIEREKYEENRRRKKRNPQIYFKGDTSLDEASEEPAQVEGRGKRKGDISERETSNVKRWDKDRQRGDLDEDIEREKYEENRRRKKRNPQIYFKGDTSLDEASEEPAQVEGRGKRKGDISERETSNVKRWDKDRQRGDLDEDIEREKYEENRRRKKRNPQIYFKGDTSLDEASEEPAQVEGRGKRKGDISERETSNVKRWDKDRQRGDLDEDIEREKYEENRRRKKRNPQIYFKGDTSLDEASEEPAQVEGRGKRKGDISERETSNVKRWDKDRQRGDLDEDIEREKYEENRRRKKRNPQIYFKGDTSLDEASEEPAQVEGRGKRKGDISERETSNVKRWDKDRQRGDLDEDIEREKYEENRRRKKRNPQIYFKGDTSLDEASEEPAQVEGRGKRKGDISERETSNVKRWDKDRQRGDLDEDIEREKYEENRRRKKRNPQIYFKGDTSLDEASEEPAQVEGRGKRKGDISERETSNVKRWDKDRQRGDLDEDIEREKYEENRRRKKRNPQIYFKGDTSLDEASEEPAQVEGRGKRKGDISERETSNVKRWDKDRQRGDLDEDIEREKYEENRRRKKRNPQIYFKGDTSLDEASEEPAQVEGRGKRKGDISERETSNVKRWDKDRQRGDLDEDIEREKYEENRRRKKRNPQIYFKGDTSLDEASEEPAQVEGRGKRKGDISERETSNVKRWDKDRQRGDLDEDIEREKYEENRRRKKRNPQMFFAFSNST
ncbi:hypothetical protein RF11_15717 [Thelohanellus kitauei]|uniref:Uncharacterized protein n=1 Tax=Thelohanellus kitauei TaxID=669202 RepID=A0A0C2IX66_THEKT|nr:hypothetical protein RF11_15717 [Thelohanellus kitauei]